MNADALNIDQEQDKYMLLEKIQEDLKVAMKAHDSNVVSVLRMLISSLKYAGIDNPNMTEVDEINVLMGEAKKRREAIEAYKNASQEKADQERSELEIIQQYLPEERSDAELTSLINEVKGNNPDLAVGPLMGKIMGEIKSRGWLVDGMRIKSLIESL